MTAMFLIVIPVIEGQFFSDLNISKSNNPDTTSGEFGYTIRRTGMVDVAGSVAEHSAINVILSAEGKNIDIPLGYALGTFGFRNSFPYIPDNPGVFFNILEGKQSLSCNTRFPNLYTNFHYSPFSTIKTLLCTNRSH